VSAAMFKILQAARLPLQTNPTDLFRWFRQNYDAGARNRDSATAFAFVELEAGDLNRRVHLTGLHFILASSCPAG
jgi:hypothetical protein